MKLCSFPPNLPNIATLPKFFCIEGKTSRPHLESSGSAQDLPVRILLLQAKGSAWSPSDFWLIHTSQSSWDCACQELAASPSLASWLGGHLAHEGRGTELTGAAQLSARGPGPCWQNHSPCSSDEDGLVQVEHQVFRAKNKLEMWAQAILAKSSSVQAGHCPMGTLEHLWAYRNPRNKLFMTFLLAQLPLLFFPGGSLPSINASIICLIKMKSIFDTSPPDPTPYSRVKDVFPPLQREAMLFLALYFQSSWATLTCHFFSSLVFNAFISRLDLDRKI